MATNGGIAIKGVNKTIINEYEKIFGFSKLIKESTYNDFDKFNDELFENYLEKGHQGILTRGIQISNEWTIIVDPEIIDWLEKEKLEQLSQNLNTEIFTYTIQTTSSSFGFAIYDKSIIREFISIDGQIQSDFGNPLTEENNLEISEQIFFHDIVELADKLGIKLIPKTYNKDFIIKEWADNSFQQSNPTLGLDTNKQKNKPWWRIL